MAELFSNAAAYEGLMGRWSTRLAPLFMDFAQVKDGERVLDVGCGTGSLVGAMADRGGQSEIVGIDPAQPSIDYCRAKFSDPRFTFDIGSAMDLPYATDSFDQSLSLLVFTFIPQPEKAASEMRRVTHPGGTIAACNWDPSGVEMNTVLWEEAARLDAVAKTRAESSRNKFSKGKLTELWSSAGLEAIEEVTLEIRTDFSSFDDYWLPYTTGIGPLGLYVQQLLPEQREDLRAGLRKRLLSGKQDGEFSLGSRAFAVRGTVPKPQ
jgi:SAM-dependent methyltransferase